MPTPDFAELRGIKIDPELLSRGSGERVSLHEALVYDFMPRILGSRFAGVEELCRATHFYSGSGSFMAQEEAWREVAEEELKEGNLTAALEAYKKSLHAAVGFATAMSMMGRGALLSPQEIDRLNLRARFGKLEDRLTRLVVSQDVAFDLPKYVEWLNHVRRLEKESRQLSQQFFTGTPKHPDNPDIKWNDPDYWDTSTKGDPEIGKKLIDTYVQMQRYQSATWICKEIGDEEGEAKFTELTKTDPIENPKFQPIYFRLMDEHDSARNR